MLKFELKKIYKSPLLFGLFLSLIGFSFLVFYIFKGAELGKLSTESDKIYGILISTNGVLQITVLPMCFIFTYFSFQLEHISHFLQTTLFKKISMNRFFIYKVLILNLIYILIIGLLILAFYLYFQNKFKFSVNFRNKLFISFSPIFLLSWVHFMFLSSIFLYIKNTPIGLGIVALYSFLTNFDLPYNIFFFMNKASLLTYPIFYSNYSLKFDIDNFVLNAAYTLVLSILLYCYWYKKYRFKIS
jgi:hypothetical protein